MISNKYAPPILSALIITCLVGGQNDNLAEKSIPEKESVHLAAFNFSVLDAKRTHCARQDENVWLHCVPEWISNEEEINLLNQVIEGFWKSENGKKLPEGAVEPRRYGIDLRYRLQIINARPEDTGTYTCTIILKSKKLKTSTIRLIIYALPKFGIEFPLIFRMNGSCIDKKKLLEASLNEVQGIFCGFRENQEKVRPACQYNVHSVACKRVTLHTLIRNDNPEVFLEITVRKLPHPKFKSPICSEECMNDYYSFHINSNLDQVINFAKRAYEFLSEFLFILSYHPTKLLTMRQYFHVCPRGFRLKRNCHNRQAMCLPCNPGTYSEDGLINYCNKCPVDTYQSEYGSTSCNPCDLNQGTGLRRASTRLDDCRFITKRTRYPTTLIFSLILLTIACILVLFGLTVSMLEGWCPMNMGTRLINKMEQKKMARQAKFIAKVRAKAQARLQKLQEEKSKSEKSEKSESSSATKSQEDESKSEKSESSGAKNTQEDKKTEKSEKSESSASIKSQADKKSEKSKSSAKKSKEDKISEKSESSSAIKSQEDKEKAEKSKSSIVEKLEEKDKSEKSNKSESSIRSSAEVKSERSDRMSTSSDVNPPNTSSVKV